MNAEPYFVRDDATVRDAVLVQRKTGGVPAVDAEGAVVGFVTDGDIMKYVGRGKQQVLDATYMLYVATEGTTYDERVHELLGLGVMDIATREVVTVDERTPVESACTLLAERHVKKLPVTRDGKLTGTLSRADIARATMAELASDVSPS